MRNIIYAHKASEYKKVFTYFYEIFPEVFSRQNFFFAFLCFLDKKQNSRKWREAEFLKKGEPSSISSAASFAHESILEHVT